MYKSFNLKEFELVSDMKVVLEYITGESIAYKANMIRYLKVVQHRLQKTIRYLFTLTTRNFNTRVDALSGLASTLSQYESRTINIYILDRPSTFSLPVQLLETFAVRDPHTWFCDIQQYLEWGTLTESSDDAQILKTKALRYQIVDITLYIGSREGILLRCVTRECGKSIVNECHNGICCHHLDSLSLAIRIKNMGYYWADAWRLQRKYNHLSSMLMLQSFN